MKKILYVFDIMNRGGAETFTMNIFKNIDRKKILFDFLCLNNARGAYDDEIEKLGGKILHVNGKSKNILIMKEIIKVLKKNKYDAIHITIGFYSGIICVCAKIAGIKKIIVHSHSAGDEKKKKLGRSFYCNTMRFLINSLSDYKLACGNEAGNFLFGKNKRFEIIYNSVDLNIFKKDEKYSKEIRKKYNLGNSILIGEVARFSKVKNHMFFLKLAKYIQKNNLDMKIILVGDGQLKENIVHEVLKNKFDDIFVFTGNTNEVYKYLNAFDVLVMPSLFEGFPVSVVESLACGTPCLLSENISKEAAIIQNMVLFLKLEDLEEKWIDRIFELSNRKKDGINCQADLIKKGFNIKSSVCKLEKIYNE